MSARNMHLSRNSSDPSTFWKVNDTNCEDPKPPDILNGFQKIPVVVLKRYNIEKYLRTNNKFKRFTLRECFVYIERLNLGNIQPNKTKPYLKCDVCEKIYYNEKKLENHKQIKHELCMVQVKIPKKVTFCDEVTVFEPQLYHKCRKCKSIFKNYTDLKSHTKHKHKKRKCYICHFCDKQFVDRMFFKVHIKLHCIKCGTLFDYKHECVAHRKLCIQSTALEQKCNYCAQNFGSNCRLKYHIAIVHRKLKFSYNQLYVSKLKSDCVEFICLFCKYVSTNWIHFQTHVNTLYNLNKIVLYKCDNCDSEFTKEEELIEHKKSHRVVSTVDSLRICNHNIFHGSKFNKTIPCYLNPIVLVTRTCNLEKYFDKLYKIKVKKKRLKLEKSDHQCNVCNKFFTSAYVLRRHKTCIHFDFEKNFCRDCKMSFDWPSQLINHECVYWKEKERANAVVDLTVDVAVEGLDEDMDDHYEDMMIPAPIVELTEYDNEYRFDKNGKMQIDNGLKLNDHNQLNNFENNKAISFDNSLQLNDHQINNGGLMLDNSLQMNDHSQFNNGLQLTDHQINNGELMLDNSLQLNDHSQFNNGLQLNNHSQVNIGLQLNNHNQLNIDNNALMQYDNGLKLQDHNYCNNNKVIRINKEGKLLLNALTQYPSHTGLNAPHMVSMTPYQINNHFITGDTEKTFHAVRYNILQSVLCNGLPQPVMPPLVPFADKEVASTDLDRNL